MYHRNRRVCKIGGVGIGGYFYTLLVASVCGAVCAMLAWGGFEKYIKYIASLVCIVLLVSPFRSIDISQMMEGAEEDTAASDSVSADGLYSLASEMTEERAEEYISGLVFSEFGINAVYTDIKIDWGSDDPIIESISVALDGSDMAYAAEAEEYLVRVLGGEVKIVEG